MSPLWLVRLVASLAALMLPASPIVPAALLAAVPTDADATREQHTLAGQFLIASPTMADPRFRQTVLVMLRHNRDGAIGIVINRPAGDMPLAELMAAIGEKDAGVTGTVPVFVGGPVRSTSTVAWR